MSDTLPLAGIKVIDFSVVQAGPICSQLLAWFGADVLKVERVDGGDVTRHQLRDIPDVDALYFTMMNCNKRSLAINTKTPEGLAVMEKLIRGADVFVENLGPGAMDRMGLSWEHLHELNPRLIYGSVKGFNENSPWKDLKVYENVAQAAGGAASTTGFWDGPPVRQDQVRGRGHPPQVRGSVLPGAVHEGDRPRPRAARERHHRGGQPEGTRPLHDRRQPDQVL
jgi:formyl-CoA transferase